MRLTVIGSSGSVPGTGNPASGYLVSTSRDDGDDSDFQLLLDCGPGVFGELSRHLDPSRLDAIGLSHLHPDHCLDLCAMHVAAQYSPTAPWPVTPVHGPDDTRQRLIRAHEVPEATETDLDLSYTFHSWQPSQQIGPFTVTTAQVNHPVPCWAIRISDGTVSLTYSGDTGLSESLVELARGTDLLLCEVGFGVQADPPPNIHLTAAQAADIAVRAEVGSLVLTHITPWDDPEQVKAVAATVWSGQLATAEPGATFDVNPRRVLP